MAGALCRFAMAILNGFAASLFFDVLRLPCSSCSLCSCHLSDFAITSTLLFTAFALTRPSIKDDNSTFISCMSVRCFLNLFWSCLWLPSAVWRYFLSSSTECKHTVFRQPSFCLSNCRCSLVIQIFIGTSWHYRGEWKCHKQRTSWFIKLHSLSSFIIAFPPDLDEIQQRPSSSFLLTIYCATTWQIVGKQKFRLTQLSQNVLFHFISSYPIWMIYFKEARPTFLLARVNDTASRPHLCSKYTLVHDPQCCAKAACSSWEISWAREKSLTPALTTSSFFASGTIALAPTASSRHGSMVTGGKIGCVAHLKPFIFGFHH